MSDALHEQVDRGMYHLAGYEPVDFDAYHRDVLPGKLRDGGSERVHWDVAGRAPIAFVLPGERAWSYVAGEARVELAAGVAPDAETVVELSDEAWIDYLYEMRTRIGLLYSNAVSFRRGSFETWDHWDAALRCLYSDREIYRPDRLEFLGRDGSPLDLQRAFTLDDDREDMSHFLRTTGFLLVKRAFDAVRIAELSAELDRVRAKAVEGELTSWWSDDGRGNRYPYRLTYLSDQSPVFAGLYDDPRVVALRELSKEKVVPVPDRIEGILAVVKEFAPGSEMSGYANLDYHNDCGMGGCHITCPCVLVGIQLDAMHAGSSQLRMLAGTWGKAFHPFPDAAAERELPVVVLETEPGDATVHFGCGLHAGPGPTGPQRRRTIYVQHYHPRALDLIGPYGGYNQIMPGYGVGEIRNIAELQSS